MVTYRICFTILFPAEKFKLCDEKDLKMVVIDSLDGYVHSMPHERYLTQTS